MYIRLKNKGTKYFDRLVKNIQENSRDGDHVGNG